MSVPTRKLLDTNGADLAKAEDAPHTSGDYGFVSLAVRKDTAAALAGTDGDYIPLIVDASGNLRVALATTPTIDIGDVTLLAGSALIGKVGIDQTTPGTTNKVDIGGNYTTPTHTAVTVGATTTEAKAANANRLYALFANDGTETIYLGLGTNAVMNIGVPILSGGSYEMSKQIGNLYLGAVNAICTSGGMILATTEGV